LHEQYLDVYLGSGARRFLALMAAKAFESQFLPEHRDEVQGLAQETGMDEREAALAQCFLDLSPMTACSTIALPASAAPDHVARFGRDLDFPSLNVADKYSTVFVYHPQGRYQFAAIGWPGMIGVLSGMNEHGLALANMEITRSPRIPSAMPYTLLYRSVLEQCRTVREAIDYLGRTPRQTANNLMLMDASGDRAVVEITPEQITVRRAADDAALISTNHQRGSDCDSAGRCKRFDYLHDTAEKSFGRIDQKSLHEMLAHVAQGKSNLQSMIFEPADRIIWLSTGARAASGTFYRLDLQAYFSPKTSNVAVSTAAPANQPHAGRQ
jgi:predicted choloylglycine hydrolase